MPITWSRLHQLLALTGPRPLTVDDTNRAIALDLDEDEALDFKAQLRTDEHAKAELAKDVAAMANSGGGLIVYGIGEDPDDKHLVDAPIPLAAEPEQPIHQLVAARVRPVVEPICIADGTDGYLLVQAPDSTDAPHFYEHHPDPKNPPGAPIRYGSGTLMMRERDIERAYRDRFVPQTGTIARLERLVEDTNRLLDFTDADARHWAVIASTSPAGPPIGAPRPTGNLARETREAAHQQVARRRQRERVVRPARGDRGGVHARNVDNRTSRSLYPLTAYPFGDTPYACRSGASPRLPKGTTSCVGPPVRTDFAEDLPDGRKSVPFWDAPRQVVPIGHGPTLSEARCCSCRHCTRPPENPAAV